MLYSSTRHEIEAKLTIQYNCNFATIKATSCHVVLEKRQVLLTLGMLRLASVTR